MPAMFRIPSIKRLLFCSAFATISAFAAADFPGADFAIHDEPDELPSPPVSAVLATAEPAPSAAAVLARVRASIPEVPLSMTARVTNLDPYGKPTGRIEARGELFPAAKGEPTTLRYTLLDPEETVSVRLLPGAPEAVPAVDWRERIRGSVATWGDLSFSFFYWDDPRIEGRETLPGRGACTILRLAAPEGFEGDGARLWVHDGYGAVLRGEILSRGTPVKRYDVLSVRKLRQIYMIGEMEIVSLATKERSRLKVSDLDFASPEYTEEEKAQFNAPASW
jgi:hypothetical protein